MNLEIVFGALAPPLQEQLAYFWDDFRKKEIDEVIAAQKDADCITRLVVRGLLNESTARQARQKLLKALCKTVKDSMP